ncbi:hypothetical protein JZ751_017645 [Albula glossodonta]|uniref:Uncharacterized protein n=1 Tax=Albula glossodonta TaxID=121402 RepID=A0A8T2PL02_9TELE|nr:hypothetical protein JZ751_017645 [Albula glossodonta]
MSRSQYENEALRRKLKVMESKLVLVRGCTESKEARKNSLKCSGSLHDMEKGVSASLVIKDKGHKVDWMNGNHEEGQMISGERPSDCGATEQRSPFEQQLNESVCDKRLQSAACPEEEDTLVIPIEGLELHRCGSGDDMELTAKVEEGREPASQKLCKAGFKSIIRRPNSLGVENTEEYRHFSAACAQGHENVETKDPYFPCAGDDSEELTGHTEQQPVGAVEGSCSNAPFSGSLNVKLHIGTSVLASVKEEAEIKTICIDETGSERVRALEGQDRETLFSMKSEDVAFVPRSQGHQASEVSQSMAESGSDTEDPLTFHIYTKLLSHGRPALPAQINREQVLGKEPPGHHAVKDRGGARGREDGEGKPQDAIGLHIGHEDRFGLTQTKDLTRNVDTANLGKEPYEDGTCDREHEKDIHQVDKSKWHHPVD